MLKRESKEYLGFVKSLLKKMKASKARLQEGH